MFIKFELTQAPWAKTKVDKPRHIWYTLRVVQTFTGDIMSEEIFFDDTYKGDRYTYGLKYRPLAQAQVPDGWIVFSDREHKDFPFGTVDYPRELSEAEVSSFEMEAVL